MKILKVSGIINCRFINPQLFICKKMDYLRSKRKGDEEARHPCPSIDRQKRKGKHSESVAFSSTSKPVNEKMKILPAKWNLQDQFRLIEECRRYCRLMSPPSLDQLPWEIISRSVSTAGKNFTAKQCKEKFQSIRENWTICFKKLAKAAEHTGLAIDHTTGRFNGPIENLHIYLEMEEKEKYRFFLIDTQFLEMCTSIFYKHTPLPSSTSSTPSYSTRNSFHIGNCRKRRADEHCTGFEVASFDKPVPSFEECCDLVPKLDSDIGLKVKSKLYYDDTCRKLFLALTPAERLLWGRSL